MGLRDIRELGLAPVKVLMEERRAGRISLHHLLLDKVGMHGVDAGAGKIEIKVYCIGLGPRVYQVLLSRSHEKLTKIVYGPYFRNMAG